MKIVPKDIIKQLGMARSTFWDALNRLRDDGFLAYDDPATLVVERLSQIRDKSRTPNNSPELRTIVQNSEQQSRTPNNARSKPASDKDSERPIDMEKTINTLSNRSIYIGDQESENLELEDTGGEVSQRLKSLSQRPKSKLTQQDKVFLKDQLSPFVALWNQNRYPTWAACESLNESRIDALLHLYREEGDRSLELFEKAVKQMATEPYWQKIPATIDMLIRKTKGWVRSLSEKYRETPNGHHISDQDIEEAQRLQRLEQYKRELEEDLKNSGGF